MTKQISPLRQRMIDDMAFRSMSPNTQKVEHSPAVRSTLLLRRCGTGGADGSSATAAVTHNRIWRPEQRMSVRKQRPTGGGILDLAAVHHGDRGPA